MALRFQRGDIVINAPGWSGGCFCVMAIEPSKPRNPYLGLNLVNNKTYYLPDESLIKVGTATEEFLKGDAGPSPDEADFKETILQQRYRAGQGRAEREAWHAAGDDKKRWQLLAAAKPGDRIRLRHSCGHSQEVLFRYVLERGKKFVFVAEDEDKRLGKYPLDVLYVDSLISSLNTTNPLLK